MRIVAFAVLLVLNTVAHAQVYPARPIRLIVPYPPGGATDIIARAMAQKLSDAYGQQVVVDNRGGGGQIIGTDLVAKAPPNGYTLLLPSVTHSINPGLHRKLPYDSVRDFAAVSQLGSGPNVVVTHPSVAARSIQDLIALAKAQPGKLNYASSGTGSGGHLAAELFKSMAGVNLIHVPYKGGGPAYVDLIAGQVELMFTSPVPTLPHVKTGKLRALATTGARRSSAMPDLPTVAEAGLKGFEASLWYGILAPAGTPADIVGSLEREIARQLQSSDMRERFTSVGVDIVASGSRQFAEHIVVEMKKWLKVIQDAGIRAD
jgi:tripartite-type tricarboxylate transporter receptor subunit TctC